MSALLEAAIQVHLILNLLRLLHTFLMRLLPIGRSISVHDMHVVNTICTILPKAPEQKVSLLFRGLAECNPGLWCHWDQLAWLLSSSRRNLGR